MKQENSSLRISLVSFLLFVLTWVTSAQDTLSVMHYNLLFYGINTSFCTNSNNNLNKKDWYLRTIMTEYRPDILTVNEISKSEAIHQHLLDEVLNTGGTYYYRKANFLSVAESDIVNMLYYNSNKLVLKSHRIAQSFVRDIDVYELYYRASDLQSGDTAFVVCVVSHLKAGTGTSNENYRKIMANNTMDFLNSYDDDANYLMMGDFNVYSASEAAYQEFLFYPNENLQFTDPIDTYGNWHSNYSYRFVHTQSTHENSNGCAAGGGMDDRFDFILTSKNIRDGDESVKYIPGTYWAIGQDGERFNKSLTSLPTNTSVPFEVLSALYGNSDHLPVYLKLEIDKVLSIGSSNKLELAEIRFPNPVASDQVRINLQTGYATPMRVDVIDQFGKVVGQKNLQINHGINSFDLPLGNLGKGLYLIRFTDAENNSTVRKLLLN